MTLQFDFLITFMANVPVNSVFKKQLGSFRIFQIFLVHPGIMSQNGLEIQGTFADRRFRLCQVDPVAHVLAKELSGAWDGESSCRRYHLSYFRAYGMKQHT